MKKIINANNIEYLRTLKDNSVDSVVTDPPYGISFMGKKWDYDVPSVELWQEVFRVLKSGGHMLVACGTRTQHRMAVNIEDAGFEIRDIVAWVYGSGFPKSMNIALAIDKKLGVQGQRGVGGFNVAGKQEQNNRKAKLYVNSKKQGAKLESYNDAKTDQAKQWNGWGTALKPSMELWTLARKPLDGTVAQNILEYGVGGLNIDGCRVGDEIIYQESGSAKSNGKYGDRVWNEKTSIGRFPANFIHDGSDEVEALFPETQSGLMTPNHTRTTDGSPNGIYGKFDVNHPLAETIGDEGSASRFFYVAKASQEERNFGLYDFEEKFTASAEFRPNHMEKALEGESGNPYGRWQPKKNIHPTVKPIELMRYLVRMITPPNGICLDPYLGSGTTAIACEMEKFNYIGIELDEQYIEIAKARVSAVKDYETSLDTKTIIKESIKEDKDKEAGIQTIFDFMEELNNEKH